MSKFKWNEESTAQLVSLAGSGEVSQDLLVSIGETLGTTARSVGAKLRNMNYEVAKAAEKVSDWSDAQVEALTNLVNEKDGTLTYAELALAFENGAFTPKQIQGKILSMELFDKVRKADKQVAPRTYTEAEEEVFISQANSGASMEALAAQFNRPIASVRGKALSLLVSKHIEAMPKQESSSAKTRSDVLEGIDVATLTVAEIADKADRSERGIKSTLSRRGISCLDYDGEAKRAKLDAKADSKAE